MDLLVVVDMQNDFITGKLGTKEAQGIVDGVDKWIRKFRGHVVATMDTHSAIWYSKSQEGRKLPIPHCQINTPGWCLEDRIYKAINLIPTGKVIQKNTFGSVDLIEHIGVREYDTVYFCGVCTDICVISNALLIKSHFPELELKVVENLCAGTTPENHEAALKIMESCQIERVKW